MARAATAIPCPGGRRRHGPAGRRRSWPSWIFTFGLDGTEDQGFSPDIAIVVATDPPATGVLGGVEVIPPNLKGGLLPADGGPTGHAEVEGLVAEQRGGSLPMTGVRGHSRCGPPRSPSWTGFRPSCCAGRPRGDARRLHGLTVQSPNRFSPKRSAGVLALVRGSWDQSGCFSRNRSSQRATPSTMSMSSAMRYGSTGPASPVR